MSEIKVWYNGSAYKTLPLGGATTPTSPTTPTPTPTTTTCGTLRAQCAQELHIPAQIRACFGLYALVNGKEEELHDDVILEDLRAKYGAGWGSTSTHGLAYRVREEAAQGLAHTTSTPTSTTQHERVAPSGQQPQRKGIGLGHQRSRSSPSVSSSELADHLAMMEGTHTVKLSTLSSHPTHPHPTTPTHTPAAAAGTTSPRTGSTGEGGGSQERRSLTPTPTRELLEEKDEAKVSVGGAAPTLEPRTSSSPPRTTPRARSKTISSPVYLGGGKGSRTTPPPLTLSSSGNTLTKPPTPTLPLTSVDEVVLYKGGSLGRSSASGTRGKRSSLNMGAFSISPRDTDSGGVGGGRKRTSTEYAISPRHLDTTPTPAPVPAPNPAPAVMGGGRARSPPPPTHHRFTPPPTVLAPMIASLALNKDTPTTTPTHTTTPSSASEKVAARPRAQTLGAKIFSGKWLKSDSKSKLSVDTTSTPPPNPSTPPTPTPTTTTTTPTPTPTTHTTPKKLAPVQEDSSVDLDLLSTTLNRLRREN